MSDDALTNDRIDSWQQGWKAGYRMAEKDFVRADPLSIVVDQIAYPPDPWAVRD